MTRLLHPLYGLAMLTAIFTGFGNMPLWKRYYIADLPGMAWSGDFYFNLNVHILAGSLLLGLGVYAVVVFLTSDRRAAGRLTRSGTIKAILLLLALTTGIVMVIKNLYGVTWPMEVLMLFNFAHMGTATLLVLLSAITVLFRLPWQRHP